MAKLLCKICGLTRPQDVELCHALGVDVTGFIFAPGSPRAVHPKAVAAMPRGPSLRAGVFAGLDAGAVIQTAQQARLDLIQLHGGEDEAFCRAVGPDRVIKALWPERLEPEALTRELERFAPVCAYFLLDAGISGGGSGNCLDFNRLSSLTSPRPWLLAGGLGPKTLEAALASCSPDGVDLNSALEESPGVKNPVLLKRAVRLLHYV